MTGFSKTSLSQEKASAEIRGEFCRTKSQMNFAVDFLVDFFGPFSLGKQEEKIHTKIHGKIQIRIWEFRGQNPHCKALVLKLLIFVVIAKFLALTAKVWQVNDHRKRQELTMNQSKTALFRRRNLKGLVFLNPDF